MCVQPNDKFISKARTFLRSRREAMWQTALLRAFQALIRAIASQAGHARIQWPCIVEASRVGRQLHSEWSFGANGSCPKKQVGQEAIHHPPNSKEIRRQFGRVV